MDATPVYLTRHFIFRVDHLFQLLGQFIDLKFRSERQVIVDLFFLLWCIILKYDNLFFRLGKKLYQKIELYKA